MIKVFTLNTNKKIELTEAELKALLDEAYWEGYMDNKGTYIYTTPYPYQPFIWTANGTSSYTIKSIGEEK